MNKPQQGIIHEADLWEQYEAALATHDWYYMMSDDHRVWERGRAEKAKLMALKERLSTIDKQRAEEMYIRYRQSL